MVIALGSDHVGVEAKAALAARLTTAGLRVMDCGTFSAERVDYPDYAVVVARAVATGKAKLGILICGTGIGMAIAANKVPGIRAAVCHDEYTARMSRQHNNANIMTAGARISATDAIIRMAEVFVATPYEAGRHDARIRKIEELEREFLAAATVKCGNVGIGRKIT